jgi:hypothetical protein
LDSNTPGFLKSKKSKKKIFWTQEIKEIQIMIFSRIKKKGKIYDFFWIFSSQHTASDLRQMYGVKVKTTKSTT